jgi:hypothetical protein
MKILGISGRKQSGKNTLANYINGHILRSRGMVKDFFIDNDGGLVINTEDVSGQFGYGIFDVTRKDPQFLEYAERNLWPFVKVYHFADPLKEMAVNLFGLDSKNVYGNDNQKNESTTIGWDSMPTNPDNRSGNLTHREFLEYFGTKIVRRIRWDAWSDYAIKKILREDSEISIIPDVRFPDEVEAIKQVGGKVVRLTRDIFNSQAESESALDQENFSWDNFDFIIDNKDISLSDLCDYLSNNTLIWEN